jgi:hypothetical protein
VGPRDGLDILEKRKISCPYWDSKPGVSSPRYSGPLFLEYKLEFILKAFSPTFKNICSVLLEICAMASKFEFCLEVLFSKKVMVKLLEDEALDNRQPYAPTIFTAQEILLAESTPGP